MPSAAEVKAVVKALEDEYPEGATSKDVALAVIQSIDKAREKSDKWICVMQIAFPGTGWHYYAIGPYSTIKQAQAAGESTLPNTMKYKRDGDGRYRAVPLVNGERAAWEAVRPEEVDHQAYIRESVQNWGPSSWIDAFKEKQGWGHKPSPEKNTIDKGEEHS